MNKEKRPGFLQVSKCANAREVFIGQHKRQKKRPEVFRVFEE